MPGKNSGHNPDADSCADRYGKSKVWVAVIIACIFLEVWGMTRYYYMWVKRRWGFESIILTIYILLSDFMVFKSMIVTKNSDPGYLTEPQKEGYEQPGYSDTCKRCGYLRLHDRINHCSRCNRCVEYMDHHC